MLCTIMSFEIKFTKNKDYHEEYYKQFLELKLLRKLEPYLATVMIAFGIVLERFDTYDHLSYFPLIFAGLGVYELFKALTKKSRWMKARMKDKSNGELITINFNEDEMVINGPNANGSVKYQAFEKAERTKFGLSIIPSKGNSIFLPSSLFEKEEQLNWLTDKLKKST